MNHYDDNAEKHAPAASGKRAWVKPEIEERSISEEVAGVGGLNTDGVLGS